METKFGTAGLDPKGYYRINSGKEGNNNKMLHRLIWEDWYGKPVPKGCVIHHINQNKTDNRIQNLQCVSRSNHQRFHSTHLSEESIRKISESKLGEKNPNFNKPLTESHKQLLTHYAKQPKSDEHKKNMSKTKNTVGYLNVSKHKSKRYKQGFCWRYSYSENGKRHDIQRVNLEDLEKEVKRRGLKWLKFEED